MSGVGRSRKAGVSTQLGQSLFPAQFAGLEPPIRIADNTWVGASEGKRTLHLCGRGAFPAPVLFVAPSVTKVEVDSTLLSMLLGSAGNLFLRCLSRAGFKDEDWFYTSVVKYLPEDGKPKVADLRWSTPALVDEIERMKPALRIIVCLGKPVLDFMLGLNPDPRKRRIKYRLRDVMGAFIPAPWLGASTRLFPMDATSVPVMRPELYERFMLDLTAVKAELDAIRGHTVIQVPQEYVTISKASELFNVMAHLKNKEREGVGGGLRVAWTDGLGRTAAFIPVLLGAGRGRLSAPDGRQAQLFL